jgi:hypothetical protein
MALTPSERAKAYRERLKSVTESDGGRHEIEEIVTVVTVEPESVTPEAEIVTLEQKPVTHVSAALLEREGRMGAIAGWSGSVWINRLGMMTGRLRDVPLSEMGGIPIGGRQEVLGPVREGGRQVLADDLDDLAARLDPRAERPPVRAMLGAIAKA